MTEPLKLKCPACGDDKIRAQVAETCRVEISTDGEIETGDDFMNDGIDRDTLYCEGCGEGLRLECAGEGEEPRRYWLELRWRPRQTAVVV